MKKILAALIMVFATIAFPEIGQAIDKYTVNVKSDNLNRGYVYIGDNKSTTDTTITPGESVTIHAVPRSGYVFTHWHDFSGTFLLGGATTTVTPRNHQTYTAVFVPLPNSVSSIADFIAAKPTTDLAITSPMTVIGIVDDYAYVTDGSSNLTIRHNVAGVLTTALQRGDILTGVSGIYETELGEHRMLINSLPDNIDGNDVSTIPSPVETSVANLSKNIGTYVAVSPVVISPTEEAEFLSVTDMDGNSFPLYANGIQYEPETYYTLSGIVGARLDHKCLIGIECHKYELGQNRFIVRAVSANPEMGSAYILIKGITEMEIGDGDEVNLIAEPMPGVKFNEWQRNGTHISDQPEFIDRPMVASEYKAFFSYILKNERTVTVRCNDESKGTVEIVGHKGQSVTSRQFLQIKATPRTKNDYFVDWTDDKGNVVSSQSSFLYDGESSISLTANFVTLYEITTNIKGNGWISLELPDGELAPTTGLIEENTVLKLKLHCGADSNLIAVTINGEDFTTEYADSMAAGSPFPIIVDKPIHIEASFEGEAYRVTYNTPQNGRLELYNRLNGTSGAGRMITSGTSFAQPTPLYIFATPNNGYRLLELTINDVPVTEFTEFGSTSMAFTMLNQPMTINATFYDPSGIDDIAASNSSSGTVRYFNLNGVEFPSGMPLAPGLYIERSGSKSRVIRITAR